MLTTTNISSFHDRLANADWNNIMSCSECQQGYSMFHKKYIKMYNDCFPVKTFPAEQKYWNRKSWLTEGIKNSIKYKRKLYIKYKKGTNSFNEKTYKVFRSRLNYILRKSERDHYDNLLTENKSNLKKMWSVINEIINKRKHKSMTSKFVVDDREIYDSTDIAEHFNIFSLM